MSIYLKLTDLQNQIDAISTRGITTAGSANLTNALTASYISGTSAISGVLVYANELTASDFSASYGNFTGNSSTVPTVKITQAGSSQALQVVSTTATQNPLLVTSAHATETNIKISNTAATAQTWGINVGANPGGAGAFAGGKFGVYNYTAGNVGFIVSTDGTFTIPKNLVVGNGYGIDFSANTDDEIGSGSITSEVLDDYEEGTWTPAIVGSSTTGSFTYGAGNLGSYTKIGRVVFLKGTISISATSVAPVGDISITGLPFTNLDVSSPIFISYISGFNTNFYLVNGTVPLNGTSVTLTKVSSAANNSIGAVTGSDIGSALTMIFSGFITT